jgi:hypothetical protein
VLYVDAFDNEHAILRFFDFSANFARELAVGLNFARLQRAPKGSKQSTRDRCNQIIYGRGMGLSKILCSDTVVLGNRSMHAEDHRSGFTRKLNVTNRSHFPFNVRFRYVHNLSHISSAIHVNYTATDIL